MSTKVRLAELANELQDIAATYEELLSPTESPSAYTGSTELALMEFMAWLHKEGFIYTRGTPFQKIKHALQLSMSNMSQMITELQKQNGMLLAGVSLDDPPEALTQPAQADPMDFTEFLEDEEDGLLNP